MNTRKIQTAMLCLVGLLALSAGSVRADYTIYPVPHSIKVDSTQVVLTKTVNLIAEAGIDDYTIARLREIMDVQEAPSLQVSKSQSCKAKSQTSNLKPQISTVFLGINGSGGEVDQLATQLGLSREVFNTQDKYDRHIITLYDSGKGLCDVIILGEHTNAVYHALASLEQILEQSNATSSMFHVQCSTIEDYADMQYRGIVEGYYGYPYSFEVKKDLMQFMKRYKMNTYLYGAKSDPYHSGYWREAYPDSITAQQEKNGWLSQGMISDLARLSLETKVNFIWAIHPNSGKAVSFHTADSTRLAVSDVLGKFEKMHGLGVRQFAVFLDDAGWDFRDVNNYRDFLADLQGGLEQRYNRNYKNPSDTVRPLHYVPHIYALNFANARQLKAYFDPISQTPQNIVVYTTGNGVWSSLRNNDFTRMHELMKRPVALWWNYPCNDNKDGRIYTADMFSTLREMNLPTPDADIPQCLGMVSNPMQQGTVAKICLFGVADYAWNNLAFSSRSNWEASFARVINKVYAPTYRYLAKYLRYEDTDELAALIDRYKAGFISGHYECAALSDTLRAIRQAADQMLAIPASEQDESTQLLLGDLHPWLLKLSRMAENALDLLAVPTAADQSERSALLGKATQALADFRDNRDYMVDALEGMGENPPSQLHPVEPSHRYLMPFINWLHEHNGVNGS